ncbi:hypothetical protein [Clostridium sp. Cult3]|mgnify:FL=1|uniref:hypothetical protein n=1 Tax=Clostridium sp. Cult3 TaxID=2079004 RepID=UPI001F2670C9|nr:hypothetical protein [Clostridium sp. Cult3]MCF6460487.1 hypothetical protein [Clostridium sp. Cult3]
MKDAKYIFIETVLFFLALRLIYLIFETLKLQANPIYICLIFMVLWAAGKVTISSKLSKNK